MENSGKAQVVRAGWVACAAICCGMSLPQALGADAAPKPESPALAPATAPALKAVPQNQKKIGADLGHFGKELEALLDEVHENLGKDASEFAPQDSSRKKIERLSEQVIPRIVERLRAGDAQALGEGAEAQEGVVKELEEMVKALKQEVQPWELGHALDHAIELQVKAAGMVDESREKHPEQTGKPPEQLDPNAKSAAGEMGEKQHGVTGAIEHAVVELKRKADEIRPTDPTTAGKIDDTVHEIEHAKPGETSNTAATEIEKNHPERARTHQEEVLRILRTASAKLPGNDDPVAGLERKLHGLEEARTKQHEAIGETHGLDPKDDEGAARAAGKQGEVSTALGKAGEPTGEQPGKPTDEQPGKPAGELGAAHGKSEAAKHEIASGKPEAAEGHQHEVLREIESAIARTKQEIASAKAGKPGKSGKSGKGEPGQPGQPGNPEPGQGEDPKGEGQESQVAQTPTPESKEHPAGVGAFAYGRQRGEAHNATWNVSLQAKERGEIAQAEVQKFPMRYRKQIENYYRSLAGE
ncbi:MAG: hypothetical protein HY291_16285 [Planctomycetes bacterium]|nr:hypothetical protein [Planctomycetota bacterium]